MLRSGVVSHALRLFSDTRNVFAAEDPLVGNLCEREEAVVVCVRAGNVAGTM